MPIVKQGLVDWAHTFYKELFVPLSLFAPTT
jgi:hypothetical protein